MKLISTLLLTTILTGCSSTDATYTQRANESLKQLPRAETESAAQRTTREDHEQAFGRKIEAFSQSDQVQPPALLKSVAPVYPPAARRAGKTGTVYVAVIIGTDGTVADAKVTSSTDPEFNAPALNAVRQWRYKPAKKDGTPVAIAITVPLLFQLR